MGAKHWRAILMIPFFAAVCLVQATQTNAANQAETLFPKERIEAFVIRYDLSGLWTRTASSDIYGFIGNNYERLRIHFNSVTKDPKFPDQYLVKGKTAVKNFVRDFQGTIVVEAISTFTDPATEDYDKERGFTQGEITSKYLFRENPDRSATGVFEGKLKTGFYTDKLGKVHYDDINGASDGFSNNAFVGVWKNYRGNVIMKCNWGDYRIPDCGDLDVGAGEFVPDEHYQMNGWQAFKLDEEHRLAVEMEEWWK